MKVSKPVSLFVKCLLLKCNGSRGGGRGGRVRIGRNIYMVIKIHYYDKKEDFINFELAYLLHLLKSQVNKNAAFSSIHHRFLNQGKVTNLIKIVIYEIYNFFLNLNYIYTQK